MEREGMKGSNNGDDDDDHLKKDDDREASSSCRSNDHDSSSNKPQSPSMAGYDPDRIPASVFSPKSGAAEWSAASNESLFSIPMGNNSFSNDYAIMYGKSGDYDTNTKSGELPRLDKGSHPLPPVMETQDEGNLQSGDQPSSRVDKRGGASPRITQSPTPTFRPPPSSQPNLRSSDASIDTSCRSFAFPVLTSHSGKKEQASIKMGLEKNESRSGQAAAAAAAEGEAQPPPPAAQKPNKWFSCFFCRC